MDIYSYHEGDFVFRIIPKKRRKIRAAARSCSTSDLLIDKLCWSHDSSMVTKLKVKVMVPPVDKTCVGDGVMLSTLASAGPLELRLAV